AQALVAEAESFERLVELSRFRFELALAGSERRVGALGSRPAGVELTLDGVEARGELVSPRFHRASGVSARGEPSFETPQRGRGDVARGGRRARSRRLLGRFLANGLGAGGRACGERR